MLGIDGSRGEGGGQILRSSIALSIVTGTPFRIEHIRAGRKKPGLMPQHLTAVRAGAAVSDATVEGDDIGSQELVFKPRGVRPTHRTFAVGTAGSTTLVLQTVLPALLLADGPSRLTLEGGTHNPHAPPFDFLARAFLPLVNRMGPEVHAELERHGFYPGGGGRITVTVTPCGHLESLTVLERGEIRRRRARATVANLPRHIAQREINVVRRKLGWPEDVLEIEEIRDRRGPGNVVSLEVQSDALCEVFTGFGAVHRPAEAVATRVVQVCQRYLRDEAPVGPYLTDQLLLPLAIAGCGSFRSTGLSRHATTHIELIRRFLDVNVVVETLENGAIVHVG